MYQPTEKELLSMCFHLSVRLDDYEKDIKRNEKKGADCSGARKMHAELQRLVLRINPTSLSGTLTLLDGSTISPADVA